MLCVIAHPTRGVLADHDAGQVDIRARDRGHDRRVNHTQVWNGAEPTVLIDHCHWIVSWTHPDGATGMELSGYGCANIAGECVVRANRFLR